MLSKTDLFSAPDLEEIIAWAQNPELLEQALSNQQASIYRELNEGILHLIEGFLQHTSLFPISKEEFYGIEDLYTHMQLMYEGGEDALPD